MSRLYDSSLKGDYLQLRNDSSLSVPVLIEEGFAPASAPSIDAGLFILQVRLPVGPLAGSPEIVLEHASVTILLEPFGETVDKRLDLSTATRRARATALHAQLPLKVRRGAWTVVVVDLNAHATAAWGSHEAGKMRLKRIEVRGSVDVRSALLMRGAVSASPTDLSDACLFPHGSAARAAAIFVSSGEHDWLNGEPPITTPITASLKALVRTTAKKVAASSGVVPLGGSPGDFDFIAAQPLVLATPLKTRGKSYRSDYVTITVADRDTGTAVVNDISSPPPQLRSPLARLAARSAARRALVFDLLKSPETADALASAVASSPAASAAFSDATDLHAPVSRLPVLRAYMGIRVLDLVRSSEDTLSSEGAIALAAAAASSAAASAASSKAVAAAATAAVDDAEEALLAAALAPLPNAAGVLHRALRSPPPPPPPQPSNPWSLRPSRTFATTPTATPTETATVMTPSGTPARSRSGAGRLLNSPSPCLSRGAARLTAAADELAFDASAVTAPRSPNDETYFGVASSSSSFITPRRSPTVTTLVFGGDGGGESESIAVRRLNFSPKKTLNFASKNSDSATQTESAVVPTAAPAPARRDTYGPAAAAIATSAAAAASAGVATAAALVAQPPSCQWYATFVSAYASLDVDLDKLLGSINAALT